MSFPLPPGIPKCPTKPRCPYDGFGGDDGSKCALCDPEQLSRPAKPPVKIIPKATAPKPEVKKSEPPVEQMPPEQMIYLVRSLQIGDMDGVATPVSKVESVLRKASVAKGDFYFEATNPGRTKGESRDASEVKNRVYVDIDGGAFLEYDCPFQTDEWLERIQRDILKAFADNITEPHSVMEASARLPNNSIKLSYRITFTHLHGTKAEVEKYVMWGLLPKFKEWLKDIIPCDAKENLYITRKNPTTGRKETIPPNYPFLNIDKSVYDVARKMRMWNCVKDASPENKGRPNKLVVGEVKDTYITYIPPESKQLVVPPEPSVAKRVEPKPSKPAKKQMEEMSVAETTTTTTGDPLADDTDAEERHRLVMEVLDNLSDFRADDYDCWMRVGFILFNIGMDCDNWVEFSKRSRKFKEGECEKRWATFTKGALREATLWKWLREDNVEAYDELSKERSDFWALIGNANHAEVAHFFYNLKPNSYLYHTDLKWYQLQPTGIWLHFDKEPAGLLNDIWETFKPIIREHIKMLDLHADPESEEGKRIQKRLKSALQFNRMSGDSRFAKGVLDYLPYNYFKADLPDLMDESKHLFAFSDCVWDFNKSAIRPIRPEDYICLNTGYAFPDTPSEEAMDAVMDFIRGIFEPDEHIRESEQLLPFTAYFLRTIADKLHGNRRFQEFHLWTGLGGNGKGLLRNLIARTFGRYFQEITHQVLTKTQEKQNSHSPEMAMAKGKRILMATEPDANDALQVSIVKAYTGGDQISARAPYGTKPVQFKPQFGLFCQCNMKPRLSKADGGVQRRLRVNKFPFQFKEHPEEGNPLHKPADSGVEEDTLRNDEWRNAFLYILLKAYKTISPLGLDPPPEVMEASEEYMDENNPVKSWFKDNFRVSTDKTDMRLWIGASEIHHMWDVDNPNRKLSDASLKNFLEVGCGLTQIKERHTKRTKRWVITPDDEGNKPLTSENGEWVERELRAGKYWVGVVPIGAPHPDGREW